MRLVVVIHVRKKPFGCHPCTHRKIVWRVRCSERIERVGKLFHAMTSPALLTAASAACTSFAVMCVYRCSCVQVLCPVSNATCGIDRPCRNSSPVALWRRSWKWRSFISNLEHARVNAVLTLDACYGKMRPTFLPAENDSTIAHACGSSGTF